MDDSTLLARHRLSQPCTYAQTLGPGGRLLHPAPGVMATITPSVPDRSQPNAVLYEDPESVTDDVLDELQDAYATAGVNAWAVLARPGDRSLAQRLEARGHTVHDEALIMASDLRRLDLQSRTGLDLDPNPDWATVGRLNDSVYGQDGDLERILAAIPADTDCLPWVARIDGQAAGAVVTCQHDGDVNVTFVAVLTGARGRGLAAELLRHALRQERERGAVSASLESTEMGEPVYRRVGFRNLGVITALGRQMTIEP